MNFILEGITAKDLTHTVETFCYKDGEVIADPTITEVDDRVYIASGITINKEAVLVLKNNNDVITQHILSPKNEIDVSYVFVENEVKIRVAYKEEGVVNSVTSCTATLRDENYSLVDTITLTSDHADHYSGSIGSVTFNENMTISITIVKNTVEFTKEIFLATQLIRI